MLDEASERLQPTTAPREVEIDGYVTTLHHDRREGEDEPDAEGATEPFRVWVWWNDRGEFRKVQFDLDEETHRKAVNAYDRKAHVKVGGRLERLGKKWVLLHPQDFRSG